MADRSFLKLYPVLILDRKTQKPPTGGGFWLALKGMGDTGFEPATYSV
jgi:hypothetical protein